MSLSKSCDIFVTKLKKEMKPYPFFNTQHVESFGYIHCFAIALLFRDIFKADVPAGFFSFINKKMNFIIANTYNDIFLSLMDNPQNINLGWIPDDCGIDREEFIEAQLNSPVNLSMLIYLSFCFYPKLLMNYHKAYSFEPSINMSKDNVMLFIEYSLMNVLDIFDEFNSALLKECHLFHIPR